jgi:hypothetical protein
MISTGPEPPPPSSARRMQMPARQRNQENSEEAAMRVLAEEINDLSLRRQEQERDSGVMDTTPPGEGRVERYLNAT